MLIASLPYKFQHVWATGAGAGPIVDPIPDSGASGGHADQQTGWTATNMTDPGAGGIPPFGTDDNGVKKYITSWLQWLQAGGPVAYDATFQGWIGGYPNGALVRSATIFGKMWLSTVDNNASDPDTGGADWAQWPPFVEHVTATPGSSTFTVPLGVFVMQMEAWGAGAGGGGGNATGAGGGGSGGGYARNKFAVTPGDVLTLVVGGAGSGGIATGNGGDGTATTITSAALGLLLTADGGSGGLGVASGLAGGQSTTGGGSGGSLNANGGQGLGADGPFGGAYFGGDGGFGGWSSGQSTGPISATGQSGNGGQFPGGGGTGGAASAGGGTGSNGLIILSGGG
jgi:hypothetical protein